MPSTRIDASSPTALAYGAHPLDILCVIWLADLDFECAEALLLELTGARADRFRPEIHAQSADEVYLAPIRPAEKAAERNPI